MKKSNILSLLVIFLLASASRAQDDSNTENANQQNQQQQQQTQPEQVITIENSTPKLGPSPDASTSYVFPTAISSRKFLIAKDIPVVLGFRNKGNSIFNVTRIFASLMYPTDHRYYIQNFTRQPYGEFVRPSEERSFLYKFSPDLLLEPRDYGLVVSVFYSDLEGGNFTNVVFNSTIGLMESTEGVDSQSLFTYVGLLGVAGLVGFVVYKAGRNISKKKGRKVEYGTQNVTVIDNEWLEGTAAVSPKTSSKSPRQKPKKS